MDTIILVGGKGTRLHSIVNDRPKPLAEVAGHPFLEWLLRALRAQGLRHIILATGYKGDMVEHYFGEGKRLGLNIVYSHETLPQGTAGAARKALSHVTNERMLIMNGDSFCHFDVRALTDAHQRMGARTTLWLVETNDCRRYGLVDVEPDGKVTAFREKSPALGAGLINAGVYLCEREVLATIPTGQMASLESDVFPALIGHGLYAMVGKGPFLDIGTPESYRSAGAFFAQHGLP